MFIGLYRVCYFNGIIFISQEFLKWRTRTSLQALQRRTTFWRTLSKTPDLFRIVSHAARIVDTRYSSVCTFLYAGDVLHHMFHNSNWHSRLTHSQHLKVCKNSSATSCICSFIVHMYMLFDMWSITGTFIGCMKSGVMCVASRVLWFVASEPNSSYACQSKDTDICNY